MGKDASAPKKDTKESKPAATKDEKPAVEPKKAKGSLEEDDEFEDFPADAGWDEKDEGQTLNAWEDVWEDEDEAVDFAALLKVEQEKKSGVAPMKM
ncbi:hypothetical protein HDU76_010361 [Blyttiomyces sp. JEL0837]|nr:hypothetical protein HDU76_010361 [Blyttiomyces sp. JEL0837]